MSNVFNITKESTANGMVDVITYSGNDVLYKALAEYTTNKVTKLGELQLAIDLGNFAKLSKENVDNISIKHAMNPGYKPDELLDETLLLISRYNAHLTGYLKTNEVDKKALSDLFLELTEVYSIYRAIGIIMREGIDMPNRNEFVAIAKNGNAVEETIQSILMMFPSVMGLIINNEAFSFEDYRDLIRTFKDLGNEDVVELLEVRLQWFIAGLMTTLAVVKSSLITRGFIELGDVNFDGYNNVPITSLLLPLVKHK